ncbi:unnamed protein product, partial [Trichogramma brassicae]
LGFFFKKGFFIITLRCLEGYEHNVKKCNFQLIDVVVAAPWPCRRTTHRGERACARARPCVHVQKNNTVCDDNNSENRTMRNIHKPKYVRHCYTLHRMRIIVASSSSSSSSMARSSSALNKSNAGSNAATLKEILTIIPYLCKPNLVNKLYIWNGKLDGKQRSILMSTNTRDNAYIQAQMHAYGRRQRAAKKQRKKKPIMDASIILSIAHCWVLNAAKAQDSARHLIFIVPAAVFCMNRIKLGPMTRNIEKRKHCIVLYTTHKVFGVRLFARARTDTRWAQDFMHARINVFVRLQRGCKRENVQNSVDYALIQRDESNYILIGPRLPALVLICTLDRKISIYVVLRQPASSVKLVVAATATSSIASNETINQQSDVDVDASALSPEALELAHERYRRLIPYMTYYMLNNYINGQQSSAIDGNPVAVAARPRQPLKQQQQQQQHQQQHQFATAAVHSQPVQIVNKGGGGSRYKESGFVPSVQYDPREVRPAPQQQSDFFLPLRYSSSLAKKHQQQQPPLPQIYNGYEVAAPTPRPPVSANPVDVRYVQQQQQQHHQATPAGAFHPAAFLTSSQKPQHVSAAPAKLLHEDYGPVENFESVRYVSSSPAPPPPPPPPPPAAVETVKSRLPLPLPQAPPLLQRYPAPVLRPQQQLQLQLQQQQPALVRLDINQVLKGLRLTSRLPEVLTKDNVDGNIKTLVEILRILDAGKRDRYQPAHAAVVHDKYRSSAHAKPQVITESNYQATQFSAVTPRNELLMESPHRHYHHHHQHSPAVVANRYISQHKVPILLPSRGEQPSSSSSPAVRPYFAEIKSPMAAAVVVASAAPQRSNSEQLVEIKPANRYVTLAASAVQLPPQEKAEQVVEIKPVNRYLAQIIKNQTAVAAQATPLPAVVPTTETPSTESKDIVEYYVPVVQDIDEGVTYAADKERVISPIQTETTRNNYEVPEANDEILEDEKYTIPISAERPQYNLPIQVQNIPPLLKYGATRGKPHVDYPAYTEIPETDFSCKKQRYKGFFGDPDTGCQYDSAKQRDVTEMQRKININNSKLWCAGERSCATCDDDDGGDAHIDIYSCVVRAQRVKKKDKDLCNYDDYDEERAPRSCCCCCCCASKYAIYTSTSSRSRLVQLLSKVALVFGPHQQQQQQQRLGSVPHTYYIPPLPFPYRCLYMCRCCCRCLPRRSAVACAPFTFAPHLEAAAAAAAASATRPIRILG